MKILQVITSVRMGGAEKLVAEMIPMFVKAGHEVHLLVFDGIITPLLEQLESQGIKVIRFNNGGTSYNPIFIWRLITLIPKYDIVHTHNTACQYYVALARDLCSCRHVKFVTTEHSCSNRRRNIKGFVYIDKWMYRKYDEVVSISEQSSANLLKYLDYKIKVSTIYNGIDLKKFMNARNLYNDPILNAKEKVVLCMVAGFRAEKDQDTLIKAMQYLPQNCVLWLIGDGVRRTICEQLAQSIGVSERVVFAGIRTDVPQILKSANYIVMSSHWEGLSLSSIEGMSVGKPFVASDVDGLHEIVENYGLLFPHGDAKRLSEIILQLMSQPDYADEIAKKCYEKAVQYDIQITVDRYLALYASLIGK